MSSQAVGADWSLCCFGGAAAAKDGLTNQIPCADNDLYKVISTNYAEIGSEGRIIPYIIPRTAAIANYVSGKFGKTTMKNYASAFYGIDQTRQLLGKQDYQPVNIPVKEGAKLECLFDNGNNAQIEAMGFILANNPGFKLYNAPPLGAIPVTATATTALTANLVWSDPGTVTWDYEFKEDSMYEIHGAMGHSATGYFGRIKFQGTVHKPGWIMGDSAQLQAPIFTNFGKFRGRNPPTFEHLASGADGDVYNTLWIKEL